MILTNEQTKQIQQQLQTLRRTYKHFHRIESDGAIVMKSDAHKFKIFGRGTDIPTTYVRKYIMNKYSHTML